MLFFRYAVGYNAGTGADEHFSVFLKRKPDCNAGVHISGEIQIADRTAVNAALVVFQLVDDLAGTELWCTGEGSGRENGIDGIDCGLVFPKLALYSGTVGHDVGVTFD